MHAKRMLRQGVDYLPKDKKVEYCTMALLSFLPKWKGFLINEAAEAMDATEALTRLDHVVECLSNVWIEECGYYWKRQHTDFHVGKVYCESTVIY